MSDCTCGISWKNKNATHDDDCLVTVKAENAKLKAALPSSPQGDVLSYLELAQEYSDVCDKLDNHKALVPIAQAVSNKHRKLIVRGELQYYQYDSAELESQAKALEGLEDE